jgi:hypothetical protein
MGRGKHSDKLGSNKDKTKNVNQILVAVAHKAVTALQVVMEQLAAKLQEAFNLPTTQAAVLVNGKSHRIKCG